MSATERDAAHCPHCGGELPEPEVGEAAAGGTGVSFCPSCGRRVEGWRTGFRATVGGANAPATHPDGEEQTRAVAPSAALLRAAVAAEIAKEDAKRPADEASVPTDRGAPVKPRSSPFALLAMIGGAAAIAIGALVVLGRPHRPPATIVRPAPTIVPTEAPTIATTPDVTKPETPPAPVEPAKPAATKPTHAPATKTSAPVVKEPAKAAKAASGALPHKSSKTDSSASLVAAQPSGTAAPVASQPVAQQPPARQPAPSNEPEQAPQTPQQLERSRRDDGAAQMDAQNVRFVVQSHLAQVQACYSRAFKDSAPGGRVDIGFVVGQNGRASKVRTEQNQTRSTLLSGCLEHLIADWQFVRPASGELELIYPFVFSPGT